MCLTGHILILEVDLKELPYDPQSETIEDLQLAGLSLIQKKKAFRYGMDSVYSLILQISGPMMSYAISVPVTEFFPCC